MTKTPIRRTAAWRVAALPAAILLAAVPMTAAAGPTPPAFTHTPDLAMLETDAGAAREYARLKRSVKRYCNAHVAQDVRRVRSTTRCAGVILETASRQMPERLLALYEAEGGRAAAISVARLDL